MTRARQGVALIAVAVALMTALAGWPWLWHRDLQPMLEERRGDMALLERKSRHPAGTGVAVLDASRAATAFVKGATDGLALAEMQRLVTEAAETSGLVVERIQPLPAERRDAVAVLRLEADALGGIDAVQAFLHGVETMVPLLFVVEAHLGPSPGEADGEAADRLAVRLTIEGFARPEPGP